MRGAGLAFIALVACGDSAGPIEDAGAPDATSADAELPDLEWPELSVGTTVDPEDPTRIGADARPADLSCLGVWDWPEPGPPADVDLLVTRDAVDDQPLADQCLRLYLDDEVDENSPCAEGDPRTDATGRATVSVLGDAPFAIRVFASVGPTTALSTQEILFVDQRASGSVLPVPGGGVWVVAPSVAGFAIIPLIFGHEWVPGTAVVGAGLTDCSGMPIYGARLRIALADGTYVDEGPERADPAIGYFDAAATLTPDQRWTHVGGLSAMLSVPVSAPRAQVFLEYWGRVAGETSPRVVACATLPVEPDIVSDVAVLEPVRRSGPRCPGLR